MSRPEVPRTAPHADALREHVAAEQPRSVGDLARLVRIPSVSWDGFDADAVAQSAEAVAEMLRGIGLFSEVDVVRAPLADELGGGLGQPAVLARRPARGGKPTVLLYAHHDVQPPGADEAWNTPPYEPTVDGDRLYGRGTADDKAGVMAHVAALRAVHEVIGDDLDLGVVVFVEGEEEYGSRSFGALLEAHRDTLAADVIVVADSDNWSTSIPSLTVSLRGNVTVTMTVKTLAHASHSGMFGGVVPDAVMAATTLLARLYDEDGSPAVPGLRRHDAPVPAFEEERLRAETGLLDGVTTVGRGEAYDRLWNQPSISITGFEAPSIQNASNTLVPAVRVKISVRVAPGQSPDEAWEALQTHLAATAPFGAHVSFDDVVIGAPFLVDTSGPAVADAEAAMEEAWGAAPVRAGVGGSIPFISDLAAVFPDAEILVTGVEDPETRAHSPNESLHLGVFQRAILTEALLLARLNERV